jgi:hypothetical protein
VIEGVSNVLVGFLGMLAMLAFWATVIFIIPGAIALGVTALFPLSGQWRERWRARKRND